MDELERIKKLAGVDKISSDDSMGENLSYTGTEKAKYQRQHNIRPGSNEWFKQLVHTRGSHTQFTQVVQTSGPKTWFNEVVQTSG